MAQTTQVTGHPAKQRKHFCHRNGDHQINLRRSTKQPNMKYIGTLGVLRRAGRHLNLDDGQEQISASKNTDHTASHADHSRILCKNTDDGRSLQEHDDRTH